MIEIICNGDGQDKSEMLGKSKSIRVPKNIKQIGEVSSERKIYIEDYAFTYINSLAYGTPEEDHAGVLLGECQMSEDEKCIFIKGVIKAKPDADSSKSGVIFDEKIWDKIYTEIERYFPDLQVVGWFVALSNVTPERMQYLRRVHLDNFAGNMKTMYLINTVDKEENFYLYENGELKKQSGYVCFYERNYEMQEYMMEKRGRRSVEAPEKDKVMRSIRTIIQEKEELKQQKKNNSILYGIGTFMVVVVLVIGINLMNNYEQMKKFDNSLNNIVKEMATLTGANNGNDNQNVVEVNKIDGNVFPTESSADSVSVGGTTVVPETVPGADSASVAETAANSMSSVKGVQSASSQGRAQNTTVSGTAPSTAATQSLPTAATQGTVAGGAEVIATHKSYVVEKGDTLTSICKKMYGTITKADEVAALNGISDANKLYVGQVIKLP